MGNPKIQCKACPWKRSVRPKQDIPGGYSVRKHRALRKTMADPGSFCGTEGFMACHESPPGQERVCVGWAVQQLGPGNNLALRLRAIMGDETLRDLRTVGPQHERFEDTLPK